MIEATQLLDGDLTAAELTALLQRLKHDAALREEVTAQQLIRDRLAGLSALDDGYTLRIMAWVRAHQARGI
jgi:negative regulator of sigma E activity